MFLALCKTAIFFTAKRNIRKFFVKSSFTTIIVRKDLLCLSTAFYLKRTEIY
jgi:hypothetical protein